MNKQTLGNDEWLRKELNRLGAREHHIAALTMVPSRGEAALRYALARGVEHPIEYAVKMFDSDWNPSGKTLGYGTNLHAGRDTPLPEFNPQENVKHARDILKMLGGEA